MKEIHNILINQKHEKLLEQIKEIEETKNDSRRMFQAIKIVNRKTESNIVVTDKNGLIAGTT